MSHIVKSFSVVNEAEVDVFLEFSCFFCDPVDVGNLISGSSAFSKSSYVGIIVDTAGKGDDGMNWEFPGGLLRLDPAFAYAEPPSSWPLSWVELLTLAPGSDRILVELFQILKDDAVESAALNMQYASSWHFQEAL